MIGSLQCVVLDCPDALVLARFYRSLLGGEINRSDPRWWLDDDWATLHTGSGLVLAFQRVDEYRPPRWPDPAHPQQFHLDIEVTDLAQAQQQVLSLGATPLDAGDGIYADPAGHPFCLLPGRA